MKNITVTVDDETYRQARVYAAQRDTSVSALVKGYLSDLSRKDDFARLKALEEEIRSKITSFSASDRLSRDELYDRSL